MKSPSVRCVKKKERKLMGSRAIEGDLSGKKQKETEGKNKTLFLNWWTLTEQK